VAAVSDEALILLRPFRAYRAIVERAGIERHGGWGLVGRVALMIVTLGVVTSLTSSGRVLPHHVVFSGAAWSFVPLLQIILVTTTWLIDRRRRPWASAVELHFAGNGPYLLLLLGLACMTMLPPDVGTLFAWLLGSGVLPGLAILTLLWGATTSFAFYRVVYGRSRLSAAGLLGVEWALKLLLVFGWYHSLDNLVPQFIGPARTPP
jgi:hypothetical protein